MAVDFPTLFQQFYPPGPGRIYVALTGNDSNAGTVGSPKRTISAGLNALGSGGGIVWCGDGDYGSQSFSDKNYSPNGWALVMAQNLWGAKCSNGGGDVINFTRCSYFGWYGFEVSSNENPGITTQIGICTGSDFSGGWCHHLAWWKNHVHGMSQGGLGAAGNNHQFDYIDVCYNTVHDTARYFGGAGSNISLYEAKNFNAGDSGFHCNVIGNVSYYAHNDSGTAQTDGNGVIIDDWMWTQGNGANRDYAKCLVMFNLCVNNGGRGVHSPWADSVTTVFNTSSDNSFALEPNSRGGANSNGGSQSRANCNVTNANMPYNNGQTWSQYFHDTYGGSILDNTALSGTYHGGDGQLRNRVSEGKNYFKNNNPNITPFTSTDVDGWRPDGGSGAIETTTINPADYAIWSKWPDWFGDYRPTNRVWAHGFAEGTAGSPTNNPPSASFTFAPSSPTVGQAVQVTDTSTGLPTGWSYNWGDGSAVSTTKNSTHNYAAVGTYTITQTVTNAFGSSTATASVTVATSGGTTTGGTMDPGAGIVWFDSYGSGTTPSGNVVLRGDHMSQGATTDFTVNINRNTTGEGYFVNPSDTMASGVGGWAVKGGANKVERVALDNTTYNKLSRWPSVFGVYRPPQATGWTIGATEGDGSAPVSQGLGLSVAGGGGGGSSGGGFTLATGSVPAASVAAVNPNLLVNPGPGQPGNLVSANLVGNTAAGHKIYQIIYMMTRINGSIGQCSGIAIVPAGTPPVNGWRICSVGHAATGLSDASAPSLAATDGNVGAIVGPDAMCGAGFVVVQSDMEGQHRNGDNGWRVPFLTRDSGGKSLIDAARSVSGIPGVKVNARTVFWGWSSGAHAAIMAGEMRNTYGYGPELQPCVVAVEPICPADFTNIHYNDNLAYYVFMIIYGCWVANQSLDLNAVVSNPAYATFIPGMDSDNVAAIAGFYNSNLLNGNPMNQPAWAAAINYSEPGFLNAGTVRHYYASSGIQGQLLYYGRVGASGTNYSLVTVPTDTLGAPGAAFGDGLNWVNQVIPPL